MSANALRKYEKDEKLIALAKKRNHVPWCDDYENMISGMQYNAMVKELTDGRHRAKQIIHKYNNHFPEGATAGEMARLREPLLHDLFGSVGKDSWVEAPMWIDFGCNIAVGDRFYANYNLTVLDCALVTIGDRVMFGPNVSIYAATHDVDVRSRQQNLELAFGVTIGDDCWIGGNVTIVAGVNIGKGCTIGAGATVTKDIPDWSVAVGCPARVVRKVDPCGAPPKDEEVNMPHLD